MMASLVDVGKRLGKFYIPLEQVGTHDILGRADAWRPQAEHSDNAPREVA